MRGIALTDGLIGTFADVHAADGLAGRCFLYHLIGNGTGRWRVPVGGMGAVSGALATAARAAGAELVTGATVTGLETGADGVTVHWTDAEGTRTPRTRVRGERGGAHGARPAARPPAGAPPVGVAAEGQHGAAAAAGAAVGRRSARVFSGTVHVDEAASQIDAAYAQAAAGRLPDVIPSRCTATR